MKRQNKRIAMITGLLLLIAGGSVMAADAVPVWIQEPRPGCSLRQPLCC